MAFVIKFAKGVRNHWKKSTFAAVAIVYGCNYAKESYDIKVLMRAYCEKAAKYGHASIRPGENPKTITVILNPNANKRKATKQFDKYCAPILNLAGICVDIVQTESEGHAKTLVEKLDPTDAIIVAGGDGTLSEVVTGVLRLCGEQNHNLKPIGVLPLGKTNTIAKKLFPGGDYLEDVKSLADASLAIIEEATKQVDVMKIEVSDNETQSKPIYALASVEWGAFRDAYMKQDKYWYWGPLRKYATYVFNGYKSDISWNCTADLTISPPCEGCSNCKVNAHQTRWYHRFLPYRRHIVDYSKINNEKCKDTQNKHVSTADLVLSTTNAKNESYEGPPKLELKLGPESVDYFGFVSEGFKSVKGERTVNETIEARQIELSPEVAGNKEMWFSIDKENFEVKPVKITLLPKTIPLFCKKQVIAAS